MLAAAVSLALVLAALAAFLFARGWSSAPAPTMVGWVSLLATWFLLGVGYSATQMPSGRLLRRSAHAEDRYTVFAAQFALSHACWLVTYPLAGWLGATLPLATLAGLFAVATMASVAAAVALWPTHGTDALDHDHPELPRDHPHLREHGSRHAHTIVIDDLHPACPSRAG